MKEVRAPPGRGSLVRGRPGSPDLTLMVLVRSGDQIRAQILADVRVRPVELQRREQPCQSAIVTYDDVADAIVIAEQDVADSLVFLCAGHCRLRYRAPLVQYTLRTPSLPAA